MIIDILAVFMEMMAYALLDNLAMGGQKGKGFSWKTCVFIMISTIYLELFNAFLLDSRWAILVHIFSLVYCLAEAKKLNRAIYATSSSAFIMIIMQMIFASPVVIIKKYIVPNDMSLALVINLLILVSVLVLNYFPRIRAELDKLYTVFEQKNYVILLMLSCCLVVAYEVKLHRTFDDDSLFSFLVFFITILGIIILWQREIVKNVKQKYENEQLLLYSQAYDSVLKSMQARQHEFDNHLNNIVNMHILYKDYDSLVKSQIEYAGGLQESYKFRKLLNTKQPILSGFLYLEFTKYEEIGAEIDYLIEVEDTASYIPIIELVEVLATLIDNAFQELRSLKADIKKRFIFEISEYEGELLIQVSNTLEDEIKYSELLYFFNRGYSTKGKNHGVGLFNTKNIIQKYSGDISVRSYTEKGEHWITIKCIVKRRRQKN